MSYYTLVASLPPLPIHFDVPRAPITRLQLRERLGMLSEEDSKTLNQLNEFLDWDRQPLNQSDERVVEQFGKLKSEIQHPLIWKIVEHRINMRTIISGLRRRRAGEGPPQGVGELVAPIRRHWREPFFGLEHRFQWIPPFYEKLVDGEALAAERILYDAMWELRYRMAAVFTFSFEAVLLYVARWTIIDRWTSRNADIGKNRFDQLLEETLGEFANITF